MAEIKSNSDDEARDALTSFLFGGILGYLVWEYILSSFIAYFKPSWNNNITMMIFIILVIGALIGKTTELKAINNVAYNKVKVELKSDIASKNEKFLKEVSCSKCNANVILGSKYCPNCGLHFEEIVKPEKMK